MGKKTTIKYLYETAGGTKWKIALLLFMKVTISFVNVSTAFLLKDMINAAISHDKALFFSRGVMWGVLIFIRVIVAAVNRFLQEDISSDIENTLKRRVFASLLNKNYEYVSFIHSGEWMTRLTNDTTIVANGMTNILPDMAGMVVRFLGAASAILLMEPGLMFLLVPGGTILILFSYVSRKKMKSMHKKVQEKDGKLRSFLQECLSGMLVIRSYATESLTILQAQEKMQECKVARMKRNHFSNFCNTGFSVLMNGTYLAGAYYCGYGILMGTVSYGSLMAILQLIGQLQNPLANFSGILPRYYAMSASAERLLEAETMDSSCANEEKSLTEVLDVYQHQLEKMGLENVSFSYLRHAKELESPNEADNNEEYETLSKYNFSINKGEYVAITGPSGCGKSTLLKLLMCLYEPKEGTRFLQVNGQIVSLDKSWQRLFAYVPQGNYLMSGTIREMVAFSDRSKMQEEEAIWEALTIACAKEFVSQLEDGLDTVLGERGAGLSEGQMQRLAIARAVFSRCPVLILDECSSALDEKTESQLLKNLRLMTDRTVIIVTHRPAALEICDRIYQVKDSKRGGEYLDETK